MLLFFTPVLEVIHGPFYSSLARFFLEVVVILVLVRVLGRLLVGMRQPMVIGEIIAGILLGPSAFGQIPGFSDALFPKSAVDTLQLISSVGLSFFMLFLGLEVDPQSMKRSLSSSISIAISSIAVPFGLGAALSVWLYDFTDTDATFTTFLLFMGTSMSFTAFPVLARVLTTSRLLASPVGIRALSCAAVDDLLAWCTLALTLSYANGGSAINGLYVALIAIGFILVLVYVANPFLHAVHAFFIARNDPVNRNYVALLFLGFCGSAWFAEILGIHAFFGAFVFGIIIPKDHRLIEDVAPKIELLIVEFFLPLYFANSGLRTQLGALGSAHTWLVLFVVLVVGSVAKIVPVTLMSRLTSPGGLRNGTPWIECLTVGVLMNTRGLVALIAINIGLDMGILDAKMFSLLVVFSVVTTFATPPLLYYMYELPYHAAQQKLLDDSAAAAPHAIDMRVRHASLQGVKVGAGDAAVVDGDGDVHGGGVGGGDYPGYEVEGNPVNGVISDSVGVFGHVVGDAAAAALLQSPYEHAYVHDVNNRYAAHDAAHYDGSVQQQQQPPQQSQQQAFDSGADGTTAHARSGGGKAIIDSNGFATNTHGDAAATSTSLNRSGGSRNGSVNKSGAGGAGAAGAANTIELSRMRGTSLHRHTSNSHLPTIMMTSPISPSIGASGANDMANGYASESGREEYSYANGTGTNVAGPPPPPPTTERLTSSGSGGRRQSGVVAAARSLIFGSHAASDDARGGAGAAAAVSSDAVDAAGAATAPSSSSRGSARSLHAALLYDETDSAAVAPSDVAVDVFDPANGSGGSGGAAHAMDERTLTDLTTSQRSHYHQHAAVDPLTVSGSMRHRAIPFSGGNLTRQASHSVSREDDSHGGLPASDSSRVLGLFLHDDTTSSISTRHILQQIAHHGGGDHAVVHHAHAHPSHASHASHPAHPSHSHSHSRTAHPHAHGHGHAQAHAHPHAPHPHPHALAHHTESLPSLSSSSASSSSASSSHAHHPHNVHTRTSSAHHQRAQHHPQYHPQTMNPHPQHQHHHHSPAHHAHRPHQQQQQQPHQQQQQQQHTPRGSPLTSTGPSRMDFAMSPTPLTPHVSDLTRTQPRGSPTESLHSPPPASHVEPSSSLVNASAVPSPVPEAPAEVEAQAEARAAAANANAAATPAAGAPIAALTAAAAPIASPAAHVDDAKVAAAMATAEEEEEDSAEADLLTTTGRGFRGAK